MAQSTDIATFAYCGNTRVIPLDAASANYREWVVAVENVTYCIVQDGEAWVLIEQRGDTDGWDESNATVEEFLAQHGCIVSP